MIVSLVCAASRNGVIGKNNQLPWRLPADLAHFKRVTTGHTVIMGRKTFESIGRPLPNRRNLVLTRNAAFRPAGCETAQTLEDAWKLCAGENEVFVIGGAHVYAQALAFARRIYLTRIDADYDGDAHLFAIDASWREISKECHNADAANPHAYCFSVLERGNV